MKKAITVFLAAIFISVFPLAAAASQKDDVNDIGNRRVAHRSIISEQKEVAIGKQYADQIDHSTKLIKDPVVNEYVNRLAQNLARNSDVKVPISVKIIDDPTINAFALPGGFLYVNSGTILAATEESQLAGVIAHEIAHVACRHWASSMTKQTLLQYAMLPLMFTPMSLGTYYILNAAMGTGIPMAFLKFSRDDEAEADFYGLQYMYKSGYDPNSYVAFFGKVLNEERESPGSVASVFADHPPTPDRIIKCEEEIKGVLPKKQEYLVNTSEFDDVKTRLETLLTVHRNPNAPGQPTLERRQPQQTAGSTPPPTGGTQGPDTGDQPPVLKRKD
ncbi:MAG TPA: M48 family metallopeptidase [Terriglobia bacterium]|nr:M48 family metallopeptidase [Terriglobia bacterium]